MLILQCLERVRKEETFSCSVLERADRICTKSSRHIIMLGAFGSDCICSNCAKLGRCLLAINLKPDERQASCIPKNKGVYVLFEQLDQQTFRM